MTETANSATAGSGDPPARIDLTALGFWDDPHGVLRTAREQHPVAFTQTGDPMILRYDDVQSLAADPRVVSNALAFVNGQVEAGPLVEWWSAMLTNLNGPRHVQLRQLVSRAFTPRSIDRERPRIRQMTREILARHAASGEIDLYETWAHELPIRMLCHMLGFPEDRHEDFSRWSTNIARVIASVMTPELRRDGEDAVVNLNREIAQAIAERRTAPRDDLLTALVKQADASPDSVLESDLLTLVINLIFGGHDTSRSMLAVTVMMLLRHPDQLTRLRSDPSLMAGAVEEVLRCEPAIIWMAREATQDLEVGGISIAAGQSFTLSILSANRDPRRFDDPDRFDITRESGRTTSFGWGPHVCLGAHLARAELQEAVGELLRVCEELEFDGDEPRWLPYGFIRAIDHLRVRFRPRPGAFDD